MESITPYKGEAKNVVVYNTYAAGRSIHFDVFIPTDKSDPSEVPAEIDKQALEYAKEFLRAINKPDTDVKVNICYKCHIDNTDLYEGELWKLPGKDVYIWPMEGCPRPNK